MSDLIQVPAQPAATPEQKAQRAKRMVRQVITNAFRSMLTSYQQGMTTVWSCPEGLTPQQVFDALGSDGGELLRLAGLLKDTLNGAKPGSVTGTTPQPLTVHEDGTVTVG